MPRFSIIITCYNQSRFIEDAVGSALAQLHPDKEIVVIDDASTDGSVDLLARYGSSISLKALEANAGVSAARNSGVALSTGEFLVFLDGDDLLMPWALEVYSRIIDLKHPILILGQMHWFKGTYAAATPARDTRQIAVVEHATFMNKDRSYRASASALVVERQSFQRVGGWTRGIFPMDDHDLLLKLGYSGRTIQVMSPQTTAYRVHSSNSVQQVQKVINNLGKVIERERSGQYPGGRGRRFERRAVIGGLIFFWLKRALQAKYYGPALRLLAGGWGMVFLAVVRRSRAVLRGLRPVEMLPYD